MTHSTYIRVNILEASLIIERQTSIFLAALLGIRDFKDSRTLGNISGSLPFNTKIDLLIDMGALDSETRNMFQTFMELRNQFMHNIDADSYENCISFLKGKKNFLLKKYSQDDSLSKEEQMKNAIESLCTDVQKLTLEIFEKVKEKIMKQADLEVHKISSDAYLSYFQKPNDDLFKYFDEQVAISPVFNSDRLRDIAFYLINSLHQHWLKAFNEK